MTVPVLNLDNCASGSASHVRVGPGVVPGLAASTLATRKDTICNGVSVGTSAGVTIATARKYPESSGSHETTLGPTPVSSVTHPASKTGVLI